MEYKFKAYKEKEKVVAWIRKWFKDNGPGCNAVIGISGGKDSSVAAALCVEALGRERVIGVTVPNHSDPEPEVNQLKEHLGISLITIKIDQAYDSIYNQVNKTLWKGCSEQTSINLTPRLRMSTIYAVSQSMNGRVCNTCNLSEDWIGYSTRWGDSVGDFSPLSRYTVTEVKAIGRACGLPDNLIDKVPADGLCGKTDEESIGYSYDVLDKYIRTGEVDPELKKKIDSRCNANKFKLKAMPTYENYLPIEAYS